VSQKSVEGESRRHQGVKESRAVTAARCSREILEVEMIRKGAGGVCRDAGEVDSGGIEEGPEGRWPSEAQTEGGGGQVGPLSEPRCACCRCVPMPKLMKSSVVMAQRQFRPL
jgi:hypothetical protein